MSNIKKESNSLGPDRKMFGFFPMMQVLNKYLTTRTVACPAMFGFVVFCCLLPKHFRRTSLRLLLGCVNGSLIGAAFELWLKSIGW